MASSTSDLPSLVSACKGFEHLLIKTSLVIAQRLQPIAVTIGLSFSCYRCFQLFLYCSSHFVHESFMLALGFLLFGLQMSDPEPVFFKVLGVQFSLLWFNTDGFRLLPMASCETFLFYLR